MIDNKHRIPPVIWNSFTPEGKVRFNNVMDKTLDHQALYIHPLALPMPELHWRYICYQLAIVAAWNRFDEPPLESTEGTEIYTAKDKLLNLGHTLN